MPCPRAESSEEALLRALEEASHPDGGIFSGTAPAAGNGRAQGKYPRGLMRLTTGPFPREPYGKERLVPQGPGSSTEGDSEAAPGARGRGELVGASDSKNRGPLCGIQSHARASSSAFGSEKRLCSRVSLPRRPRYCPGAPGPRERRVQSSPRLSCLPGAGSCIISISSEAGPGLGEEEEGRRESASEKEKAGSASPSRLSTRGAWAAQPGRSR